MSTTTEVPAAEAVIVMSRVFEAPRDIVWEAMTEARHVAQWWGGPGFTNPVCEMEVRPGGLWRHVMRFPDGHELDMTFVFLEVDQPERLVWQNIDHGKRKEGPPTSVITLTLEDMGDRTRWKMVARFNSLAERDAAVAMGFSKPIETSNHRLVAYLKKL
ncbi:MAG TPA: SRPBCC domain-containing protein [Candidatus Binataceae bacterium]|jgi:uncharacterized protein YndB with AHSA1/START domain